MLHGRWISNMMKPVILSNILSILLFVSCFIAIPVQAESASKTPVTIQLRWYHQFQFAGYYVAKELGYYDQAGLDVTINEGKVGIDPVAEVTEGRAHFGVDNSGLLWARSEGKPVKATAAIFQKSALRFITLQDTGINTPQDLVGRRVMLLPDYGSLALIALLHQNNLLEKVVRQNSTHNIVDLQKGNTDAFNGYASNEPHALEHQGIPYSLMDPADYGIKFYSDVLFTRDELSRKSPQLVDAFTQASLKGWAYALEHPERAIAITRNYAPKKDLDHLRFEANIVREHAILDLVTLGHMSKHRWQSIQDQLIEIGFIQADKAVSVDEFLHVPHAEQPPLQKVGEYLYLLIIVVLALLLWLIIASVKQRKLMRQVDASKSTEEELYNQATHDPLTGLPNRLLLLDRLELVLAQADSEGSSPLIAFIDLDDLKKVNDTQGHERGDYLLKLVAEVLTQHIPPTATLARYGGDEFVYVSNDVNANQANVVAQRLLHAIHEASERFSPGMDLTASIGLLLIKQADGLTAEDALKRADASMYKVKAESKSGMHLDIYFGESV